MLWNFMAAKAGCFGKAAARGGYRIRTISPTEQTLGGKP